MSKKSLYFSSLGCSKNLVDSQVMLGYLGLDGYTVVEEPKDADDSVIFEIYKAFAAPDELADLRSQFEAGIAWGDAKQILFEKITYIRHQGQMTSPFDCY